MILIYFLRSTIVAIFNLLRNSICYFGHLYIELYISKNYKNWMLWKYVIDDSNKISIDFIFPYTLAAICKISLNDK